MNNFISLSLIKDPKFLEELKAQAEKDRHGLFLPTHLLTKEVNGKKEMVGYYSIGNPGAVMVFGWMSTEHFNARESFHLLNMVENIISLAGQKYMCLPIPKDSPFHPIMESMGYQNCGNYDFFVKNV